MSTVTSTAVQAGNHLQGHVGLQSIVVKYVATGLTAASVIKAINLPHGFVVCDGWVVAPADSFKLSVGPAADQDRYIVSATNTAVQLHRFSAPGGMGDRISLSSSAVIRHTTLDVLVGSASATGTFVVMVSGYNDGGA